MTTMLRCCCCCCPLRLGDRIRPYLADYDRLRSLALLLLYIQIGCALIGSLGAQYNGVAVVDLAVALFALVAVESSSENLARTYAFLLLSTLLLDVAWFFLFFSAIWTVSSAAGSSSVFSLRLTLAVQILGFSIRFSSSLLWFQIYRLGAASPDSYTADFDYRSTLLSPNAPSPMAPGALYDPTYFNSLLENSDAVHLLIRLLLALTVSSLSW